MAAMVEALRTPAAALPAGEYTARLSLRMDPANRPHSTNAPCWSLWIAGSSQAVETRLVFDPSRVGTFYEERLTFRLEQPAPVEPRITVDDKSPAVWLGHIRFEKIGGDRGI